MPSLEAAKNGDTPKTQSRVLMVLRQVLIIASSAFCRAIRYYFWPLFAGQVVACLAAR